MSSSFIDNEQRTMNYEQRAVAGEKGQSSVDANSGRLDYEWYNGCCKPDNVRFL
jgi:hypothetical protein